MAGGKSGHTVFNGSASSNNLVTIYYCTPTVTPCTSSNMTGSTTATPSGGTWTSGTISLVHGTPYTATAYQTVGIQLVSNTVTFTP